MHTKTTVAQKLPHEYERKIIEFHKYIINMRKKLRFEIGQLGYGCQFWYVTILFSSNKLLKLKYIHNFFSKISNGKNHGASYGPGNR